MRKYGVKGMRWGITNYKNTDGQGKVSELQYKARELADNSEGADKQKALGEAEAHETVLMHAHDSTNHQELQDKLAEATKDVGDDDFARSYIDTLNEHIDNIENMDYTQMDKLDKIASNIRKYGVEGMHWGMRRGGMKWGTHKSNYFIDKEASIEHIGNLATKGVLSNHDAHL